MNVRNIEFNGDAALEISTATLRLVVVTAYGPRIAYFGRPDGSNLLLWEPRTYRRGKWDLRGGHRVWVTRPGADENEDTYATDNEPCQVQCYDDELVITGAENPQNRTRRGLGIRITAPDRIEIDNFVRNTGPMLYSGGVWALTCTVPTADTTYAVPIGDGSSWDAFSMVCFREWGGHGQGGFADPQIELTDELVLVKPAGIENKRMIQSHLGIIAMSDPTNNLTFAKKMYYEPAANYPLHTNIALYIGPDNFMVEMETMGPEETLKPGMTLHHHESWLLHDGAMDFACAKELQQLFAP